MKMYSSFVGNYNLAVLTIADLKQKSPQFVNFLDVRKVRIFNNPSRKLKKEQTCSIYSRY